MGLCPFCKQNANLDNMKTEVRGLGVIKQERMYMCPSCNSILGFAIMQR